jgi:hypothetical protein
MAWLDGNGGLAFVTDAAHLRHVRVCHAGVDRLEWIRRRVDTIEQTTVRLIPFSGLSRVDGAGDAGIVALERSAQGLELSLFPLRSDPYIRLEIQAIRAGGSVETLLVTYQRLTVGTILRLLVSEPGDSTAWRGRLVVTDPAGASFATDFVVAVNGDDPGGYLRGDVPSVAPVTELWRGDRNRYRKPPRSFAFDAAPVSLPTPWLSDQPNRLRVLAFIQPTATASIIALAHHFDFDLTAPFVPYSAQLPTGTGGIAGQNFRLQLGDRYEGFSGSELVAAWTAALDPSRQYDVILLGIGGQEHEAWGLLPHALQTEILNRIQAGTGLVCVRRGNPAGPQPPPVGTPTERLQTLLPLTVSSTSDFLGEWRPSSDATVQGLLWSVMADPGRIFRFAARAGVQTLLEIFTSGRVRLPVLARTTYGTGRVLDMGWSPHPVPLDRYRRRPAGTERMETLRYDLALLARVVFDAAGRVPPITVRNVTLGTGTATVELDSATTPAFVLDWVARDRFDAPLGSGRETHATYPAGGIVTIPISPGAWTVDATVTPSTGSVAWGAGGRVLDFGITISPNVTVVNPGDQITITPAPVAGAALYVADTVDGRNRVVARSEIPPGGSATIDAAPLETPFAELRVHALDGQGQLLAQAVRGLRVRRRSGIDGFPLHFWNTVQTIPQTLMVRQLDAHSSFGISSLYNVGERALDTDLGTAADRLNVPYGMSTSGWLRASGGIAPDGTGEVLPDGTLRPFSLTNATAIANGRTRDTDQARAVADGNVLFYHVADDEPDPPRTDVSHDPETLSQFQSWLRERYGYADALLQQEWGPAATLASAAPRSFADAVAAFPAELTYAPWLDHRRFIMDLFSRMPTLSRESLRYGDPQARTITSGESWTGLATGRDWWVRGRALDVVGRYRISTGIELAALGTPSMAWTGYDDPDPILRYRFWNALGLGESGQALFNENTFVNPDLTLPEVGRDLAAALLPIRRGVGRLFAASRPADDGIYVLSSPDSSCVLAIHGPMQGTAFGYESLGRWISGTPPARANDLGPDSREGVHDLLAAMGVGWRAISPSDVESGALERRGARLLILPMCAALSAPACEAIQRWVSHGGRVIADLLPGVFTSHGRLRGTGITPAGALQGSTNPLDAMFGVSPGARPPIANATVTVGTQAFPLRCVDTALVATPAASSGGTTGAGAPVWFTNASGQGQAVYLGCSLFADYHNLAPAANTSGSAAVRAAARMAARNDRTRMETAFAALLQNLGINSHVTLNDAAGQRVPLCQFRVRSVGDTELVVLLKDFILGIYDPVAPETDAEITFANSAYTYDLETGAYLGHGRRLPIHVSAYSHRAFARLPYRVDGVDLRLHSSRYQLGDRIVLTAALTAGNGAVGEHYLRLDVIDHNGRPIRYLGREALAHCGEATFTIPTAVNDPAGVWTIVVADVATGVNSRVQIDMGARSGLVPAVAPVLVAAIDD